MKLRGVLIKLFCLACACTAHAQFLRSADALKQNDPVSPRVKIAVLDFNSTSDVGARAGDELAAAFVNHEKSFVAILDRAQVRAAARGQGYTGSLNLTLDEARDLGAALDCDFFIAGAADTSRRLPSSGAIYFESFETVFIVSARTGRLIFWNEASAQAATPEDAEKKLRESLLERAGRFRVMMLRAQQDEDEAIRKHREEMLKDAPTIEDAPDEDSPAAKNFRPPAPYARLRPAYTPDAARREVAATVDAQVTIDARGQVVEIEIVRWAGYGLDESVVNTVRKLHFRPAMRNGAGVPVRVLLRYNFRRDEKQSNSLVYSFRGARTVYDDAYVVFL